MGKRYIIDTNAIIDFAARRLPEKGTNLVIAAIDTNSCISIINKIELLGFSIVPQSIIEFVEGSEVIPLSDEVALRTVTLRKKHKLKLPDAIIAATALVYDLTLITRNEQDFKNISGLKLVNPYNV
jgi:predicted nucleic acid-binding protein